MKPTLNTLVILMLSIMIACTDNPVQNAENDTPSLAALESGKQKKSKIKAKKFKAEFFSSGGLQFDLDPTVTADICGAGPFLLNIQQGTGSGSVIGDFSYYASFCADISNFDIGQVIFFETEQTTQYLTTAPGDTLFLPVETGSIGPSEVPGYDLQFLGSVSSSKGTGRLQSVSIEATTQGLVILQPERTDHSWEGTITFDKKDLRRMNCYERDHDDDDDD